MVCFRVQRRQQGWALFHWPTRHLWGLVRRARPMRSVGMNREEVECDLPILEFYYQRVITAMEAPLSTRRATPWMPRKAR
jgi:hypothetical protein